MPVIATILGGYMAIGVAIAAWLCFDDRRRGAAVEGGLATLVTFVVFALLWPRWIWFAWRDWRGNRG